MPEIVWFGEIFFVLMETSLGFEHCQIRIKILTLSLQIVLRWGEVRQMLASVFIPAFWERVHSSLPEINSILKIPSWVHPAQSTWTKKTLLWVLLSCGLFDQNFKSYLWTVYITQRLSSELSLEHRCYDVLLSCVCEKKNHVPSLCLPSSNNKFRQALCK